MQRDGSTNSKLGDLSIAELQSIRLRKELSQKKDQFYLQRIRQMIRMDRKERDKVRDDLEYWKAPVEATIETEFAN